LETLLNAYGLFAKSPIQGVVELFHSLEEQRQTNSPDKEHTLDTSLAFASEAGLARYLADWVNNYWKQQQAGGTGRSGNEVVPASGEANLLS